MSQWVILFHDFIKAEKTRTTIALMLNVFIYRLLPLTIRNKHIHHAHFIQLFSRINFATGNQAFSQPGIQSARQKAECPHPRKKPENRLWKSKSCLLFSYQHIG